MSLFGSVYCVINNNLYERVAVVHCCNVMVQCQVYHCIIRARKKPTFCQRKFCLAVEFTPGFKIGHNLKVSSNEGHTLSSIMYSQVGYFDKVSY